MLGIAKRKAGTSVKCPRCAADVRVPALAGMAVETNGPIGAAPVIVKESKVSNTPSPQGTGKRSSVTERKIDSLPLFERPDFESLLNPALEKVKPETVPISATVESPQPTRTKTPSANGTKLDDAKDQEAYDVEDLSDVFIISRTKLMIATIVVVVLMIIAFVVGYVLASSTIAAK